MSPRQGYLALVLHAHLPFVRHPEHPLFLEEDWLFEAITETYLPLLQVFERLMEEEVPFVLTMSLTPTLCEMLSDPLLQARYSTRLARLRELVDRECHRTRQEPAFHRTALMYRERLREVAHRYEEFYRRDLLAAFRRLQEAGRLEIITSAATHGFLPLFATRQGIRAQLRVAQANYVKHFRRPSVGVWLPECGYNFGLDEEIVRSGFQYFFLDSHGLLYGTPRPKYGVYAPVVTPAGAVAFGRDIESSLQVWSSQTGYPGDPVYREFYRDIGYDGEESYIAPYLHEDGLRRNLGIKYHRVTGPGVPLHEKAPYDPVAAREKAAEHAGNFMFNREAQASFLRAHFGKAPLIVAPYDAELFGHWWYEGPDFLNILIRRIVFDQENIALITPTEYLGQSPTLQHITPSPSSWGDKGYFEVWLNGANDWIYRDLHRAEERMVSLARDHRAATGMPARVINQAARELMLAQSSDWAFIMTAGTMVEYACKRTCDHLDRFAELHAMARSGAVDEARLSAIEHGDNLFPEMDFRVYCD
ncbi:MAG: 1,4-alpha-glucan branching protein domain-containing protein [Planctomycetota bacterium]